MNRDAWKATQRWERLSAQIAATEEQIRRYSPNPENPLVIEKFRLDPVINTWRVKVTCTLCQKFSYGDYHDQGYGSGKERYAGTVQECLIWLLSHGCTHTGLEPDHPMIFLEEVSEFHPEHYRLLSGIDRKFFKGLTTKDWGTSGEFISIDDIKKAHEMSKQHSEPVYDYHRGLNEYIQSLTDEERRKLMEGEWPAREVPCKHTHIVDVPDADLSSGGYKSVCSQCGASWKYSR